MSGWLSVGFEVLRVAFVASIIFVLAWQCLKLRRTPFATFYGLGGLAYVVGHLPLFRRRRNFVTNGKPDEGNGDAAVPALVGTGPRGPRFAADAKARPEV